MEESESQSYDIKSERLILTPVSLKFKEEIFKEFSPEITVHMYPSSAQSISDTESFILDAIQKSSLNQDKNFTILKKDTSEFLGGAGIHHIDTKTPELGIWVKKAAHGKRYGREAVEALIHWAEKNLSIEYFIYPAMVENIASRKTAESLGGKLERYFEKPNQAGTSRQMVEYRIYPTA